MGRKPICDLGKPLRVGLIGAGGMADYHVAGFKKAGAEVVAIADPNSRLQHLPLGCEHLNIFYEA